jgi:hypothetical protein
VETPIKGRCLCGAVTFALTPPTDFLAFCHCRSCRLSHGAPFVAWTSVPRERFEYLAGEEEVAWHRSSEWILWGSCRQCGSPMLYQAIKEGHPESPKLDRMYVAAGSLVDPLDRRPSSHVSYEEKVSWMEVTDDLKKYRSKGPDEMKG